MVSRTVFGVGAFTWVLAWPVTVSAGGAFVYMDRITGRRVVASAPMAPEGIGRIPPNWKHLGPEQERTQQEYADELEAACTQYGVDPDLAEAVIMAESAWQADAESPAGARGLMQLMPATAKRMGAGTGWHPAHNINGGIKYLGELLRRYNGDIRLAAAAYNAGEGAVDRYKGVPPYRETREYVKRVERYYEALVRRRNGC